jgi:AcrR family transcriptional regulator
MVEPALAPARGRGRPRDPAKDSAIREAACAVLAEKGYDGLTFEAVADQARCSRASLYRRFGSKLALVEAALEATTAAMAATPPPDSDPRQALIVHAAAFTRFMAGERGRPILTLMETSARRPELRAMLQRQSATGQEEYFRLFRRLGPAGLTADRMEFAFDTLVGAIIYHVAFRGRALAAPELARLVDQAVRLLGTRRSDDGTDAEV